MKKNGIRGSILVLGVITILLGTTVVFSEPGSEEDPLVSLSYLEKRMEQFKYYVDEKLDKISTGSGNDVSNNLEVVEIMSGQSIIGKNGTEIILRSGRAKIIAGKLGGLSDVTEGKDLGMDKLVPLNHLLIIPRDDNRGVLAITEAIFLVKGEYEIK